MKQQSFWLDTSPPRDFPPLQGRVEVDVLVVGGGLTGLTTAYLLKKAGYRIAVVDQKGIGGGDTAHTTAHVTFVTDTRLHKLASQLGKGEAQAFWGTGLLAMRQIEQIASELNSDCELRRVPAYLFAAVGKDTEQEEHELYSEGGVISYGTVVTATHVPIQGERGTLDAAFFQTKLAAYSTYALEAEVEQRPESLFWDTNEPYLYLRFDQRDGRTSLIIGGEDHKTGQEEDTEARYERLGNILKKNFPSANVRHRWSGQVLETPDGLPYIGEVAERQFLATGFSGNGMTLGTFSAILMRDLITGKSSPWTQLFAPNRKSMAGTWDYVRENKDFLAYFIKDRFGSAVPFRKLEPGNGEVMEIDGKKGAVYCDETGTRTVLSPICPHMGCLVAWNKAERTWDCPCHGSRFAATGEVIAGPAESGLKPMGSRP